MPWPIEHGDRLLGSGHFEVERRSYCWKAARTHGSGVPVLKVFNNRLWTALQRTIFPAKMHQIAGFCISNFKSFSGGNIPGTRSAAGRGNLIPYSHQQRTHGAWIQLTPITARLPGVPIFLGVSGARTNLKVGAPVRAKVGAGALCKRVVGAPVPFPSHPVPSFPFPFFPSPFLYSSSCFSVEVAVSCLGELLRIKGVQLLLACS